MVHTVIATATIKPARSTPKYIILAHGLSSKYYSTAAFIHDEVKQPQSNSNCDPVQTIVEE